MTNILKFADSFVEDTETFKSCLSRIQQNQTKAFDYVFLQVVKVYLGIDMPNEYDIKRFSLGHMQGQTVTLVYLDDKHIGNIELTMAYQDSDFVNNKITCALSFTPILPKI